MIEIDDEGVPVSGAILASGAGALCRRIHGEWNAVVVTLIRVLDVGNPNQRNASLTGVRHRVVRVNRIAVRHRVFGLERRVPCLVDGHGGDVLIELWQSGWVQAVERGIQAGWQSGAAHGLCGRLCRTRRKQEWSNGLS